MSQHLFKLFAVCNSSMIKIAELIRSKPRVVEVVRSSDIREYGDMLMYEAYVDAEFEEGNGFSWGLELSLEANQWVIRAALRQTLSDGQIVVQEHPEFRTESFDEFNQRAIVAINWLIESAKTFNIAGLLHI
jgi:hypothetical protein